MPIFRGDQATAGWAKETTYGTANDNTSGSFGIMESFNAPDPTIDWKIHRTIGNGRDVQIQSEGKNTLETGISVIPQDLELLEFAFGQRMTSGNIRDYFLGSGKTWVYTGTASGAIPSMTIETTFTPGQTSFPRQFVGMKVDKMTIGTEEEGELKLDFDLKGARPLIPSNASPVPCVYTNSPFLWHHGSMSMWGTTFGKVTKFELTLTNNLKPKYYLASGSTSAKFPQDMIEGVRDYELITTVIGQDSTVWSRLTSANISGFTTTMRIADTSHAVDIVCEYCNISQAPHSIPEDKAEIPIEIRMKPRVVTIYEHYPPSMGF